LLGGCWPRAGGCHHPSWSARDHRPATDAAYWRGERGGCCARRAKPGGWGCAGV